MAPPHLSYEGHVKEVKKKSKTWGTNGFFWSKRLRLKKKTHPFSFLSVIESRCITDAEVTEHLDNDVTLEHDFLLQDKSVENVDGGPIEDIQLRSGHLLELKDDEVAKEAGTEAILISKTVVERGIRKKLEVAVNQNARRKPEWESEEKTQSGIGAKKKERSKMKSTEHLEAITEGGEKVQSKMDKEDTYAKMKVDVEAKYKHNVEEELKSKPIKNKTTESKLRTNVKILLKSNSRKGLKLDPESESEFEIEEVKKPEKNVEMEVVPLLGTRGIPKGVTNAIKRTTSGLLNPGLVMDLGINTIRPMMKWLKTQCKYLPLEFELLISMTRKFESSGAESAVQNDAETPEPGDTKSVGTSPKKQLNDVGSKDANPQRPIPKFTPTIHQNNPQGPPEKLPWEVGPASPIHYAKGALLKNKEKGRSSRVEDAFSLPSGSLKKGYSGWDVIQASLGKLGDAAQVPANANVALTGIQDEQGDYPKGAASPPDQDVYGLPTTDDIDLSYYAPRQSFRERTKSFEAHSKDLGGNQAGGARSVTPPSLKANGRQFIPSGDGTLPPDLRKLSSKERTRQAQAKATWVKQPKIGDSQADRFKVATSAPKVTARIPSFPKDDISGSQIGGVNGGAPPSPNAKGKLSIPSGPTSTFSIQRKSSFEERAEKIKGKASWPKAKNIGDGQVGGSKGSSTPTAKSRIPSFPNGETSGSQIEGLKTGAHPPLSTKGEEFFPSSDSTNPSIQRKRSFDKNTRRSLEKASWVSDKKGNGQAGGIKGSSKGNSEISSSPKGRMYGSRISGVEGGALSSPDAKGETPISPNDTQPPIQRKLSFEEYRNHIKAQTQWLEANNKGGGSKGT